MFLKNGKAALRRHTAPPVHLEQQARRASRILERERLKLGLLHSKPHGTLAPGAPTDSRTPHHTDTPEQSSPAHAASSQAGEHADAPEEAAVAEPATPEREEQTAAAAAPACEEAAPGPSTRGPQQPQQQQQQQPVFMQGVAELRGLATEEERRRSLAIRQKLLQDLDAQVQEKRAAAEARRRAEAEAEAREEARLRAFRAEQQRMREVTTVSKTDEHSERQPGAAHAAAGPRTCMQAAALHARLAEENIADAAFENGNINLKLGHAPAEMRVLQEMRQDLQKLHQTIAAQGALLQDLTHRDIQQHQQSSMGKVGPSDESSFHVTSVLLPVAASDSSTGSVRARGDSRNNSIASLPLPMQGSRAGISASASAKRGCTSKVASSRRPSEGKVVMHAKRWSI